MEPASQNSPSNNRAGAGSVPPPLPETSPPGQHQTQGSGPQPPALPQQKSRDRLGSLLVNVLSLCLASFLADAVVSAVDDSTTLVTGTHPIMTLRVLVFLVASALGIIVFILMGLTPMIPKRVFLPVTLFNPIAQLLIIPIYIYSYHRNQQVTWAVSVLELICALGFIFYLQSGIKLRWPLVAENHLVARRFSWPNLCLFLPITCLVVLPICGIYLWECAALAVDHFSDSFMALRTQGFTVQVRTYTRPDGKSIELVPMSHIGEPEFYRQLTRSFPTNAVILMEGVTDNQNLLTNKISYRRAAASLGLAEQQKEFKPSLERVVRADVDVDEFAPDTIALLNVAMLIHSKGLTPETLTFLMQYSPPPHLEEQLVADLLRKRNRRLVQEIKSRLPESGSLIVPWGVAHMPEIAKEIQKLGFQLGNTTEFVAIRFGSGGVKRSDIENGGR